MFQNRQVTKRVSRKAKTFHVKGKCRENNNIIHSTSKCLCTKSVNSLKWKCKNPKNPLRFMTSPNCPAQFSSVAQLCLTLCDPWTAAYQASLSITYSQSLLKLMSIESVMPSNHLILCCPLLLLPSIFSPSCNQCHKS